MRKITVPTLAAAISLAIFACSESPSNSNGSTGSGLACKHTGEDFGLGSALFACEWTPSSSPKLEESKQDCKDDGGTLADVCPSGENATCKSEEEGDEDLIIKIYANNVVCGDLMLKNADGSPDNSKKGGGCGPFVLSNNTMCTEFPEYPSYMTKLVCNELGVEAPFVDKCPGNAKLVCYKPPVDDDPGIIYHFYEGQMSNYSCALLNMEDL